MKYLSIIAMLMLLSGCAIGKHYTLDEDSGKMILNEKFVHIGLGQSDFKEDKIKAELIAIPAVKF